ncbi:MAG: helix-turn-helix transcriptional regulator [Turicibacter sp.]|nr:helix-turn-helix transcriptional regulator [Turicibacter sp.]
MLLGEKLRKLRIARKLSQEQLADELRVSRQAISNWELGESTPDTENLVALSDYFGVSIDYLLKNQKESDPSAQVLIKEVQPIVSSGCLKKGIKAIINFVIVWFVAILLLYQLLFPEI